MPYILNKHREKYNECLKLIENNLEGVVNKGELTYLFYAIGVKYINIQGASYNNISNAISCLNDAAEELRRRKLNPYEDIKLYENGGIE